MSICKAILVLLGKVPPILVPFMRVIENSPSRSNVPLLMSISLSTIFELQLLLEFHLFEHFLTNVCNRFMDIFFLLEQLLDHIYLQSSHLLKQIMYVLFNCVLPFLVPVFLWTLDFVVHTN